MNTIYKIEIHLYPNNNIDTSTPFFWCLRSNSGKEWCTETAGWEDSHEKAWEAAYHFYRKYKFIENINMMMLENDKGC